MNKKNKNKGFSLIELIIAIAILVILTGLLAPQFMKYIEKSREAKDIQAMDTTYSSVQAALGNEEAYDIIAENTQDASGAAVIYYTDLEAVLENGTDAFAGELQGLLGSKDIELKSKAAKGGKICIAIKYTPGKEITVDGKKTQSFGGFEIMVYCGDDTHKTVGTLQSVGATVATPS